MTISIELAGKNPTINSDYVDDDSSTESDQATIIGISECAENNSTITIPESMIESGVIVDNKITVTNTDRPIALTNNLSDNGSTENPNDTKNNQVVSIKDMVLFLILGLLSEVDVGYTSSGSFAKYIALPGFAAAQGVFASILGQVFGTLLVIFVLPKFTPEGRILINCVIWLIGSIFMWCLPSFWDNIIGSFFLFTGVIAMILTMVTLTFRKGIRATTLYMAGSAFSPLLGSGIIQLLDITGGGEAVHMIVLAVYPFLVCLAFYCLDRSAFKENKTTTTIDQESLEVVDGDDDEGGSNQSLMVDYWNAFKEVIFQGLDVYLIIFFLASLWNSAIYNPNLQSSSLSYGGATSQDMILRKQDDLVLAGNIVSSLFIGGSLLTPLGRIIPEQSVYILWIPCIIYLAIFVTSLLGLSANVFPPMPVWALYVVNMLTIISLSCVQQYFIIFVRSNSKLTKKYQEKQIQIAMCLQTIILLIGTLIPMFGFQQYVKEQCVANYENGYEGVSCDYFYTAN